jgi:hypothetical protein
MPDYGSETKFQDSYTYTIYQDGGAVKARNNKTGAVTSNATLGPLIATILASGDPSVEVQTGTYNLASGFTAWTPTNYTNVKFQHETYINVPQGYTDTVWELSPTSGQLHDIHIDGGYYSEQGASPTFLWTAFRIAPTGSNVGVLLNTIENVTVAKSNGFLYLNTNGTSWANTNIFRNIWVEQSKYLMYWEHTGTYTSNASGPCSNLFEKVSMQSSGAVTNVSPLTLGGIIGVFGQYNTFINCEVWDLEAENAGASQMTLRAQSESTMILNGLLTYLNFQDLGINTMIFDTWKGLYTRNTLNIIPTASAQETFFNFSVSDALTDTFYLANNTGTAGMFGCLFRQNYDVGSIVDQWTAGIWFQTINKLANDISASIACNVISAHNNDNSVLVNRAILDIENKFTPCYTFFPTYADFTGKQLRNAAINPTSNTMPYLNSYTYTIYQDGGAVKARNNKTGAVTSNANIDPLITTILASGDASFEVQSGTYNLHSSFAGWNVVNAITCFMQHDTVIKVPSGYTGDVWIFGSSDKYWSIIGGRYEEQSTVSSNWDVFRMAPASPNGVKFGIIRDVVVYQASSVFDFATATDSWVNSNVFDNILGDQCKKFAKFAHTSTFTDQTSGCNFNIFSNCVLQSHGSAPQVLAGFENVNGWFNVFQNCFVWDVGAGNASAVTLSFTANAKNNRVINGMIAHQLYSDLGTNNVVDDSFNGLLNPQINYNKAMSIVAGTTPGNMLTFNTNKTIDFNHRLIYNMFYDFGNVDTDNPAMFKVYDRSYGFLYKLGVNTLTADRKLKLPIMLADGEFLETGGKLRTGYLAVSTTPVTLDVSGPSMVSVSASGGARTVNLPAASGNAGQFYTIIKNDSSANTVTIDANSTETINGALTFVLTAQYQSVVLRCDGSNWLTQPNTSERTGEATGTANGSTTVFNIAHGIGTTPSTVFVECSTHTGTFTRTKDSTNIVVTFGTAPSASPSTIKFDWRAIA